MSILSSNRHVPLLCSRSLYGLAVAWALFVLLAAGMAADAQTESVLVNLTGTSGAAPGEFSSAGNLIQASDGNFYGTNSGGGANNFGTFFKIAGGGYTLLHTFSSSTSDGEGPNGNLVQGTDGNFYGTTSTGGTSGYGTVFKITPSGAITLLHSFTSATTDGENPSAGLVQGTDGNFYGTTQYGGASGAGSCSR